MINDDKRQLLLKKLAKIKHEGLTEDVKSIARSNKTRFPLSMVQRGIWFDCQMDPDSYIYNIPFACKIFGKLDQDALKEGIRRIIARHEIWRTIIRSESGEVYQQVLPDVNLDFRYFDKRGEAYDDFMVAEEGKRIVAEPIDLTNGPLVRFALFQTEDETFYFILSGHHVVYDGSSENIFCRELSAEYHAIVNNQDSGIEDPTISYGDFAEYNLSKVESESIKSQIEYWKEQLSDVEPTEFPTDFARSAVKTNNGGMIYFDIPKNIETRIREYAALKHVTVNVVMFAALNCLLYLYTRNEHISIATPVANRDNEQFENLLGCFVNTLIVMTEINPSMTFDEVVAATRDRIFSAYDNSDVPIEMLVDAINPQRDLSRSPFSEVAFNYNPRSRMELILDGCKCEAFGLGEFVVLTDVRFQIHDADDSLIGFIEYNSSLYSKDSAERILEHYLIALERLTESCEEKISSVEIVSSEEREMILKTFNDTAEEYQKDKTVTELFEELVDKAPENIALVFEDEELTYRELNERANQLAHKLRNEYGVKADDLVAICAERSIEIIVGILGIIKAGGAYVPIDPVYPADRIGFMLEDSAPKAVLTYKADIKTDIPVIDLEDESIWEGDKSNPEKINGPENLIYCIYTSGTTGKPKGVLIEHYGICNFAKSLTCEHDTEHNVDQNDKVLMFANFVFDASVLEMVTGLLSGAQLHVVSSELRGDTVKLSQYIKTKGITIAFFSPAFYAQLDVEGLRMVLTGGAETSKTIIEHSSNVPLYLNDYGPTECSVVATFWKHKQGEALPERIPIGKPIYNKKIYILNGDALCGIGIPGELCIAGDGLAREYLNRPELTAEKFVKNPYGEGRMYRTGDLARWLPDGNIEYLGRIDEQVKIRGF
ncbi:MAG: amino acid adenylation domain-containing protein, partial [Clostridiales bacterium]|nr:amino acid adenylation domain-containing protein [Clostridiales bacterium]